MLKVKNSLISVDWLKENLNDPDLVLLDASIKKVTGSGNEEPSDLGILNSRFFDIKNDFSDTDDEFPNAFPTLEKFQKGARNLGINNNSAVIVYDDKGIYSSARAWYMFKAFGHSNVAVLDGGLPEWINNGNSIYKRCKFVGPQGNFIAEYFPSMMIFFKDFKNKVESNTTLVLDARSSGRFNATEPEPRKGLRGGNIPNSKSLPYTMLMDGYKMKSKQELQHIFGKFARENKPISFSCGSGITACVLALGAEIAGLDNYNVYDGSWTEWATLIPE